MRKKGAIILKPEEIKKVRHPLPGSVKEAAGLLRRKRKAMERHLRTVRKEWGCTAPRHDH